MEKEIPNGTEVLIFNYVPSWGPKQDEERFIKGVIVSSELVEQPTMHGSPWDVRFYTVLGEDNITYFGTYDVGISGNHYFRSIEDHIKKIKRKIKDNCQKINELNNQNYNLYELITDLNTSSRKNDNEFKSVEERTINLAEKNAKRYNDEQNFNLLAVPSDKPIITSKDKMISNQNNQTIKENATEFRNNNPTLQKKR